MKITIDKLKNMRGNRITGYRASFGSLEFEAKTPAEAQQGLEVLMLECCISELIWVETYHFAETQYTAIVYRVLDCWEYKIVTSKESGASVSTCNVGMSREPRTLRHDAVRRCLAHLAQMIYNRDEVTRAYCYLMLKNYPGEQREFARWANWQEDYARLKALGHDAHYCHAHAVSDGVAIGRNQ